MDQVNVPVLLEYEPKGNGQWHSRLSTHGAKHKNQCKDPGSRFKRGEAGLQVSIFLSPSLSSASVSISLCPIQQQTASIRTTIKQKGQQKGTN